LVSSDEQALNRSSEKDKAMHVPQDVADTIVDPKAYADGARVDHAFTWLRREAPLAIVEPRGYRPFWVVSKHADIGTVELRSDTFHNGDTFGILTSIESGEAMLAMTGGAPHPTRSIIQMDGDEHRAYRRLTQAWFMPQKLRSLEGRIRQIARQFVDRMARFDGVCDFARDIAFLYPLHVIMEVIGVPERDEALMLKLTQELFGATDPELNRNRSDASAAESAQSMQAAVGDMMEYFVDLNEQRRRAPADDLASVLANAQIEGRPINALEALSYYITAATAGHDTTSSTLAGAMWALLERPEQFAMVKADLGRIPNLVEEAIRWVTPVKHFMRSATQDTELAGQRIRKGDWLMLSYPSANRDEAVFDDPFSFDIERSPNRHLAFGYGPHICLGLHLARMEMRVLWEELLPRLDGVELAGVPRNMEANFVCGPKSVPMRFKMS
jgi:cytochrome P450